MSAKGRRPAGMSFERVLLDKDLGRALDRVVTKAMGEALDHLECRDRVIQAVIDAHLITKDVGIRRAFLTEIYPKEAENE